MRHLIGIGVLVAMALLLRFGLARPGPHTWLFRARRRDNVMEPRWEKIGSSLNSACRPTRPSIASPLRTWAGAVLGCFAGFDPCPSFLSCGV